MPNRAASTRSLSFSPGASSPRTIIERSRASPAACSRSGRVAAGAGLERREMGDVVADSGMRET